MLQAHRILVPAIALTAVLCLASCASGLNRGDRNGEVVAEPVESSVETVEPTQEPVAPAVNGPQLPASTPVDPALFEMPGWSGVNFVSPSGNLQCGILWYSQPNVIDSWGCAAVEHSWEFPSSAPGDFCYNSYINCGDGIQARDGGVPLPMQRGGVEFGSEEGGARVLAYGESVSLGGITCASTAEGTICLNSADNHGFLISKSKNLIF